MLSRGRTDLVGLTDYQRARRVLSGGVGLAAVVTLMFAAKAGAPINVVPVAAVGLTIVSAAVAVGGLLGFLFGIPRLLQDGGRPPVEGTDLAAKSQDERRAPYAGNTSLDGNDYKLVISDLSRPGDRQAGFTLLSSMKEKGLSQPFILYSASGKPELDQDARAKGAIGSTNSPSRLVELVSSVV